MGTWKKSVATVSIDKRRKKNRETCETLHVAVLVPVPMYENRPLDIQIYSTGTILHYYVFLVHLVGSDNQQHRSALCFANT